MTITAENLGKRFGRRWIFRGLALEVTKSDSLAITGPNGSGKSTLIQILAGYLSPSEGTVLQNYQKTGVQSSCLIGFTAPYLELPEEFTFREFIAFHSKFRDRLYEIEEISDRAGIPLDKPLHDLSSGMKRRAQLSSVFYFQNDGVFMDEPTANLDTSGFEWWLNEVEMLSKLTIIASNQLREGNVCSKKIKL